MSRNDFPPHKFPSDLLRTAYALALGKARRAACMSKAELSRLSGYSDHYLSALEKGDRLMSQQALFTLCAALGLPVPEFMAEVDGFLKIRARRKARQGFLMGEAHSMPVLAMPAIIRPEMVPVDEFC